MSKTFKTVMGWIVSIVIAIIGTYTVASNSQSQSQTQIIYLDGKAIGIDAIPEAYRELEEKYESEIAELKAQIYDGGFDDETKDDFDDLRNEDNSEKHNNRVRLQDVTVLKYDNTETISYAKYDLFSNAFDNVGNRYSHGIMLHTPNHGRDDCGHSLYFYMNKKYSSLSFTLALHNESRDTVYRNLISIYADDTLIFSDIIYSGYLPQSVNLEIENTDILEIEAISLDYGNSGTYWGSIISILGDAYCE